MKILPQAIVAVGRGTCVRHELLTPANHIEIERPVRGVTWNHRFTVEWPVWWFWWPGAGGIR